MGGILCINLLRHSCTYICGGLILRYILFCPRLSLFPFFFFFFSKIVENAALALVIINRVVLSEERLYDVRWPLQYGHGHRRRRQLRQSEEMELSRHEQIVQQSV